VRVGPGVCVGPFVLERPDEAFDLAVPARRVDRRADVVDVSGVEQLAEAAAVSIDHRVVGHHSVGRVEAELGEEAECTLERACVRLGVLPRVQLDVGDAGVVVNHAMEVVVADAAVKVFRGAIAGNPVTGNAEAGELLDVHVQKRARP